MSINVKSSERNNHKEDRFNKGNELYSSYLHGVSQSLKDMAAMLDTAAEMRWYGPTGCLLIIVFFLKIL